MTGQPLPEFTYHPDPVATGSVVPSDRVCVCCGRARGFVYEGPVYTTHNEVRDRLCPWCIADGAAAERFGASFTSITGDLSDWPDTVPASVLDEIEHRTVGFIAWQDAHWMFHCDDGAEFLGLAGRRELDPHPDALEMLRHEHDEYGWDAEQVEDHLAALDADGQPTAYLFRCRHCGVHLAYSDFT